MDAVRIQGLAAALHETSSDADRLTASQGVLMDYEIPLQGVEFRKCGNLYFPSKVRT